MAAALATVRTLYDDLEPRGRGGLVLLACEPTEPYGAPAAQPVRLDPLTAEELARIHDGECEADLYERGVAWSARVRSAIDVRLAEGLHLLRKHDRLAERCFHLDDYVREVLDVGEHAGVNLAKLGGELRERPLLRAAMETGRVLLRAAQTVARVAVGEAEAFWVERAAHQTVRELEDLVRRAGEEPPEPDEDWLRLCTHMPPEERLVVDAGLECAQTLLPGSSRAEQWEAMAQEFLGGLPGEDEKAAAFQLRTCFRPIEPREPKLPPLSPEDREGLLAPMDGCPAPDIVFDDTDPAEGHVRKRPRTVSQRVRERDEGMCMVFGCSHAATDSHHVLFRSRGGGDEEDNQIALGEFHHLRCIHEGWLTVTGKAPDGLVWRRKGVPFTGMD